MTQPKNTLTEPQLYVLRAIGRGEVSTPDPAVHGNYDLGTWRIGGRDGRAVTVVAETLIRRGLARKSTEPLNGRILAVPTADGYEQLSKSGARRGSR